MKSSTINTENKQASALGIPTTMQRAFIVVGVVAYGLQLAHFARMLLRVYPGGGHVSSQFALPILLAIILPVVLFVAAYCFSAKSPQRLARAFEAMLLSIVGLLVQLPLFALLGAFLSPGVTYSSMTRLSEGLFVPLAVLLPVCAGMVWYAWRSINRRALQKTVIAVAGAALVCNGIANIPAFIGQLDSGARLYWGDLLFSPLLIEPIVLPLILFALAYFVIAIHGRRLDRLFIATVWALFGVMIIQAVKVLYEASNMVVSIAIYVHYEAVVMAGSLVIFSAVMLWQRSLTRSART